MREYGCIIFYINTNNHRYCISPISDIESPFCCENGCDQFPNMEIVDQWNTNDINIIPRSFETSGYIAVDKVTKKLFIVLRGTRSFKDSIIDISADMVDYVVTYTNPDKNSFNFGCELTTGGCKVHRGFYESFKKTWERTLPTFEAIKELYLDDGYKVIVLGHSLGGAISVLLSISFYKHFGDDIDLKCITMGQPMIGNYLFNNYVNKKFNLTQTTSEDYYESFKYGKVIRVSHLDDPIVKMPISDHHLIGTDDYSHFNGEIFINELGPQKPDIDKVYFCQGNKDLKCSFGMKYTTSTYEHLNYFRRMGKCGINL